MVKYFILSVRAILAVLAGYFLWSLVLMGGVLVLYYPEPKYPFTISAFAAILTIAAAGAALGLAAHLIAGFARFIHVAAAAILACSVTLYGILSTQALEPDWFRYANLVMTPLLALTLSGFLSSRR